MIVHLQLITLGNEHRDLFKYNCASLLCIEKWNRVHCFFIYIYDHCVALKTLICIFVMTDKIHI